jgi:hypothetical protein
MMPRSRSRIARDLVAVHRVAVLMTLLIGVHVAVASNASAQELISVRRGADGTLIIEGTGWQPGDIAVVQIGSQTVRASADTYGTFETSVHLDVEPSDLPISWRRESEPVSLGSGHMSSVEVRPPPSSTCVGVECDEIEPRASDRLWHLYVQPTMAGFIALALIAAAVWTYTRLRRSVVQRRDM